MRWIVFFLNKRCGGCGVRVGAIIKTHTGALRLIHVDAVAVLTVQTHGRAILGASSTGFGRTVRANAFVG